MSMFKQSYALIVGIDDYQHGITPLCNAVNDAQAISNLLESQHNYEVWTLLDKEASRKNIQHYLKVELPRHIQADDRLLFYFSGHGIQLNSQEGPEGYLVPQTARVGQTETYLSMHEVSQDLSALPCRHLLGIFDCCFAGSFRWSSSHRKAFVMDLDTLYREKFDRFIRDPAWQIITSAAYDQLAYDAFDLRNDRGQDKSKTQHSPFAATLITGLEGGADLSPPAKELGQKPGDGVITATELYQYVRDVIELETDNQGMRQTPGLYPLGKHDKGEYIFLTPDRNLNLPPAPPLDRSTNPYQGLASFSETDRERYFGRAAITKELYEFFIAHQLTVVLGPSGSGKSSLVKAGLLPQLRKVKKDKTAWAILPPFRPGNSPFQSLNRALVTLNLPANSSDSALLKFDIRQTLSLEADLKNWLKQSPNPLVIVIDQFEELITRCGDEERQQFLESLLIALQTHPHKLRLVITLRSDFESQFQESPLKSFWQSSKFQVSALTRKELQQVIEEPAALRVLFFDPSDLVDQLIDDVINMPGGLPLLSFTLSELYLSYLQRQEVAHKQGTAIERAITQEDYQTLGGVTRALIQRADEEYKQLVQEDPAYAQTIQQVMLRMVSLGTGELARRSFLESEQQFPEPEQEKVQTVIDRFRKARLLVAGKTTEGESFVEPAHDALVRGWPRLSRWLKQKNTQETVLLIRSLTSVTNEWLSSEQDRKSSRGLLWRDDPRLPQALQVMCGTSYRESWHNFLRWLWYDGQKKLKVRKKGFWDVLNRSSWFNASEEQFVKESLNYRYRNRSTFFAFIALVFAALAAFSGIAEFQRRQAVQRELDARQNAYTSSINLAGQNLEKAQILQFLNLLDTQKAQTSQQDLRSFEWYHLWKLSHSDRLTIQHDQSVTSAEISPDGETLATVNSDGRRMSSENSVKLWDMATGKELATFVGNESGTVSIAFSPDGKTLATGGLNDGSVNLFDIETGERIRVINSQQSEASTVHSVKFSPDGKTVALLIEPLNCPTESSLCTLMYFGRKLQLFDVTSGEEKGSFPVADPGDMSFSPDGKTFAAIVDGGLFDTSKRGIQLWDLATNTELGALELERGWAVSIEFSPDGKTLAMGGDEVRIWDVVNKGTPRRVGRHQSNVTAVKFSEDGETLITAGGDRTLKVWSTTSYQELASIRGHTHSINALAFSSDGKTLVTGSTDKTAKIWDVNQFLRQFNASGDSLSISPDGKTLAVWDAFYGRIVVGSTDRAKLLDITTGKELATLSQDSIDSALFSPDNQHLITISSGEIKVWSVISGKERNTISGHKAAFSPEGDLLATVNKDRGIELWETDTWKRKEILNDSRNDGGSDSDSDSDSQAASIAFSPDNKTLAIGISDGTVELWNVRRKQKSNAFKVSKSSDRFESSVEVLSFSPNGKTLSATSSDGTIKLWDVAKGQEKAALKGTEYSKAIAFSPDSKIFSFAADGNTDGDRVKLWNVAKSKEILVLEGHTDKVLSLGFSYDGKTLATGSNDKSIKLWNIATGQELLTLEANLGIVRSVKFTPDGKTLISGHWTDKARRIKFWHAATDEEIWANSLEYLDQDLFEKGKELAQLGNVQEASAQFQEILASNSDLNSDPSIDPSSVAIWIAVQSFSEDARALAQQGNLEESVAKFQAILRLDPNLEIDPEIAATRSSIMRTYRPLILEAEKYVSQGFDYYVKGDYEKAISSWQAAIKINREDAIAYSNIGFAYYELNKLDQAITQWKNAIELDPKMDEGWAGLGIALYDKGQTEEAVSAYRKAVKIDARFTSIDWLRDERSWSEKSLLSVAQILEEQL